MFNPDKYRSVKWQKGGRAYPLLDCFGIVNEIRRDLNLPVWPDFAGVTKDDGGLDREARRMMLTLERCEPCEGAGVACYSGSTVTHVGIVVSIGGLCMWRNAIRERTSPFCRCRGLSGDLSKWSSGNDHSFLPVPASR
ncbi:nitrite transporter [Klebsiella pneumoniae]|uniref:Nitrite transporter n=5 Tax=Klebsiella pneumoniae TaxID=573 RepID=A0A378H4J3_KLEPN|nr:nitrite transporter [Klebsiella pneumoniae]